MQTPCLIQQHLSQLFTHSTLTKKDLTSFLQVLKTILSNLINNPFDENYTIINKKGQVLCTELLSTSQAREFLALLGYTEENEQFVYTASDENLIKLGHCLELIDAQLKQAEEKTVEKKTQFVQLGSRYTTSPITGISENGHVRETMATGSLKGLFLAKHHQKEQMDNMMKGDKKSVSRSSDFAFSNNGYFHQSSNSRDSKRNSNCFMKDLFHKQDREVKTWGSPSLTARLI